ncbi:MAG: DUF3267 domain-containing protein [Clostridiales bacterium]|nr:DUF3267 domain-containing protein [Clostridiales bacterium]
MGQKKENSPKEAKATKEEHKLTEAELRRAENFKVKEAALREKGYKRKDLTISIATANFVGILLTLPFIVAIAVGYYFYNSGFGIQELMDENIVLYFIYLAIIMISFVPLAVVHEWIHGTCWSGGAENGRKDIEYGFIKEKLTPYCTCLSPLSKPRYIFGSLMPMTILGIVLGVVSIFVGNIALLAISAMQTMGGAGDILITCMLLRYKTKGKDVILMDHPTAVGLVAFEK